MALKPPNSEKETSTPTSPDLVPELGSAAALALDTETSVTPEKLIEGHEIGIATTTFYPKWEIGESDSVDKTRGDLALSTIRAALKNGYQIMVVDGGSSEAFVQAVKDLGVEVQGENERGMSASRRQAFEAVSVLDGVKVICWTEPEKVSFVQDCIPEAALPILRGEADIVVPHRGDEAFATYPDYQADFEITSNKLWNDLLRSHGLLDEDAPDLDAWIGPRLFRNDDPEILMLFKDKYLFAKTTQTDLEQNAPELWANALFLPLVAALARGYRVVGVDVPYRHPKEQTANEQDSEVFGKKRALQQRNILVTTLYFIHLLEDLKKDNESWGSISGIRKSDTSD